MSPDRPRALFLDWGGVLTAPLDGAMGAWAAREGIDYAAFRDVLDFWYGDGTDVVRDSPVLRVERGECSTEEFERALAEELALRGASVTAAGLLGRVLHDLVELERDMIGLLGRARAAGVRTGLLSNSWGDHYPDALFGGIFDAVVISGRVGMRKPEERIFRFAADQLDLPCTSCVLVDDVSLNITAAGAAGMRGVLHRSYERTVVELESLFGIPLGASSAG